MQLGTASLVMRKTPLVFNDLLAEQTAHVFGVLLVVRFRDDQFGVGRGSFVFAFG